MQENKTSLLLDDTLYETQFSTKFNRRKPYKLRNKSEVRALIPGKVLKFYVKEGQTVNIGDRLLVMEAMKMKNEICSQVNGTVKSIEVKEGEKVMKNQLLIDIS